MKDRDKVEANEKPTDRVKRRGHRIDNAVLLENDIDKLDSMPWKYEQSFGKIVEFVPEMVFTSDKKGNFLFTNKSWSEYTGYSHNEAKAISIFDLTHPDDQEIIKERFIEVLEGNSLRDLEFKSKTKDGSYIDVQISLSPVLGSEGNVVATCGFGRDITEQKNLEETFLESQEMYGSIVETAARAGNGIIMVQNVENVDGAIVFANDEALRITGYAKEELIGKTFKYLFPPKVHQDLIDRYRRREAGEEFPAYSELSLLRKNGTTVPVEYFASLTSYQGKMAFISHFRDITERKQTEQALLESQDMYKSMLETADKAGIGFGIVQNVGDKQGIVVLANNEILRITGYAQEELIGKAFRDILITDSPSDFVDRYRRRQEGEEITGYPELWLRRKDGTTVPVEYSAGITTYQNEVATIAYIKDITKRKQAEDALQQREEYFKALIENTYDVTMIMDVNRHINYVSPSIKRSLGYEQEEFMNKNPFDLIHPDDLQNAIDDFAKLMQTPEYIYAEVRVQHKNGSWRRIEATSNNLLELPSVAGIVINFRDITERKHIEEELRESELKFKAIFDNALDGICLADADVETRQLYTCNNVFCKMLGCNLEEFGKLNVSDIHPEQDLPYVLEQFDKQLKGEITLAKDIPIQKSDGSIFYTDVNSCPLTIGGKTYLMGIFRDITERKNMEEKYRQLLEDMYDGYAVLQDGIYVFTNRRFCEIFGYESGQMLGKSFTKILLPDDQRSMMALYEKVISEEVAPAEKFVNEVIKADGTTVIVEASTKPILYENKTAYSIMIRDITNLKRAQDELQHREEYFRSLIENTSDIITVLEADGNISYISPSVEYVLGYKPEELIGKTGFALTHPDDLSTAMTALMQTNETSGYSEPIEIRVHHKDGSWRTIQAIGNNLLDHPSVAGIVTNMRDVTERKNMEEKYRQLLEDMKDGYAVLQNGNVVFANERLSEIFGYQPEKVIGHNISEFIAPYDVQEVMELYTKVINGEEATPERLELMGIKSDGTIFPIQAGAKLIDYEGKPAYSVIVRDITERKHVDEMLQKSQEKLQSIVQALPDILSHVSRDGTFLDEPMGRYNIYKNYPSTFYMKKLYDVFPGDFADTALKAIKTALDNSVPQVMEHKLPIPPETKDEDIYETRIIPFGSDEVLAISRDITAQKLSERRLRTYQQQLQSLTSQLSQAEERERRRLAIDLHDLIGQSLAVIKIKLNEWKDTLQSSGHASTMKEVLKIIDSAINNTRSLTFDLSPPVLYELGLEAALEFLLEQFHERHALQYEFKDDNQEKLLEDEVRILLFRCVSELLMNVIKHSKAQLVKLSIRRENSQVSITLEDDGVGFAIPEVEIGGEVQEFGLFSVRERLNWIGGSFKLQSNPGCGTCVTLKAPLKYNENSTGRLT